MTVYGDPESARNAGVTYHLVPRDVWEHAKSLAWYTPEAYDTDGFIHCTNGVDKLVWVGNTFYTNDPRAFVVLVLDVPAIASEVRYDDEDHVFPHIYGPLNTDSVVGTLDVERAPNGAFLSIGGHAH